MLELFLVSDVFLCAPDQKRYNTSTVYWSNLTVPIKLFSVFKHLSVLVEHTLMTLELTAVFFSKE